MIHSSKHTIHTIKM